MVSVFDERLAGLLRRLNWDGAVQWGEGDYVIVVEDNMIAGYLGTIMGRSFGYQVALNAAGDTMATLSPTYRNPLPLSGKPCAQLSGGGCYYAYLRVMVPEGSQIEALPYLPLPPGALYYQTQQQLGLKVTMVESTVTVLPRPQYGKLEIAGFIEIPENSQKEMVLSFAWPRLKGPVLWSTAPLSALPPWLVSGRLQRAG